MDYKLKIKNLKNKRQKIITEQQAILDKADREDRAVTADEDETYELLNDEFDRLTKKIRRIKNNPIRVIGQDNGWDDPEDYVPVFQRGGDGLGQYNEKSQRSKSMRQTFEYRNDAELREEYENMGAYFAAKSEERALQKDLDVSGGWLVAPERTNTRIFKGVDNDVFIRMYASIFRLDDADTMGIPILDNDISDPDWRAEVSESDLDTSMDFGKASLRPKRLVKGIKVSHDVLNLSAADLAAFIIQRGQYKLGVAMEQGFLVGPGSELEPLGIFTTSDIGISSARNVSDGNTTTAIKADGLINCMYNLKSQYLRSRTCFWIFHRDALKMIRKLKDSEGNYLWQAGIGQDRPSTILGVPYILSEYAPNTFNSGSRVGCIGDLSFYGIAEHPVIRMQVLREKYALSNQIAYLFEARSDGGPLIESAFSMVTLA